MLNQLIVSGFKTVRDADLSFGRVNLFIGANGAGKSNVLEAIGLISASLKDISDIELQRRGVRLSAPTMFKSAFRNVGLRATFDLKAKFENDVDYDVSIKAGLSFEGLRFFSESIRLGGQKILGRGQNGISVRGSSISKTDVDPTRGVWDRFRETINPEPQLQRELGRLSGYAIYAPQTAFLRGTELESLPAQPIGLQGGGLAQAAQAVTHLAQTGAHRGLFKEALDIIGLPGWTRQVVIQGANPETTSRLVKTGNASLFFIDRYMTASRNVLSAYDSSEGSLYLLFIAVLLVHPRAPKILALDNVDNSLNPAVTQKLVEALIHITCSDRFRSAGIGPDQVFLTSHNPTALDGFDLFDPLQRVFVVARNASGDSRITRLEPPKGATRADWIKAFDGKRLSELWIEGHISGALGI